MIHHTARTAVAIAAGIALLAGCDTQPTPTEGYPPSASAAPPANARSLPAPAALNQDLAALRRATARFHDPGVAAAAGYTVLVRHPTTNAACLDHPTEGGMGRHMLNPTLVDDAVSVTEPEVIIYEPQKNGRLRLVGVEYVIPYAIRGAEETPPVLFGREFLHNPTFGLWMLHVYTWKNNPNGIFATWNPAITCEHDGAVD